jgi:release factor glutamine methyltransferase
VAADQTEGAPLAQSVDGLLAAPLADASERRILLAHVLGINRAMLAARGRDAVDAQAATRYGELLARRSRGEPIAYLVGTREFYGRPFATTPAALIPRPETELLVELAIERLAGLSRPSVLDLGTGSGALAVSIALECPDARVFASDVSPEALALAGANARALAAPVTLLESRWFDALEARRFDLIVSNPPYVAAADPHLAAGDLRYEPALALTDGADGLSALLHIIERAPNWLAAGAWLLLEHGFDQAGRVRQQLAERGLAKVQSWRDLSGIERASGGVWTLPT